MGEHREAGGQEAGGVRVGVPYLLGRCGGLHHQLVEQAVEHLGEGRDAGPEGQVDDSGAGRDGHADVADQDAVAVAQLGQRTGEMAVEDA